MAKFKTLREFVHGGKTYHVGDEYEDAADTTHVKGLLASGKVEAVSTKVEPLKVADFHPEPAPREQAQRELPPVHFLEEAQPARRRFFRRKQQGD